MISHNKPLQECLSCSKVLIGFQSKYCSLKCKNKYQPNIHYSYQKAKAYSRKAQLIEMKGGKCELCGYCKSYRALTFHHTNPGAKELKLDARSLAGHKWDSILTEVHKCQLLCMNCHMEIHEQWEKTDLSESAA